jgi:hypothetical protein
MTMGGCMGKSVCNLNKPQKTQLGREHAKHNLAKVGVVGSNPIARSIIHL